MFEKRTVSPAGDLKLKVLFFFPPLQMLEALQYFTTKVFSRLEQRLKAGEVLASSSFKKIPAAA